MKDDDFKNLEERKITHSFKRKLKTSFVSIDDVTRYMKENSKYQHLFEIISANQKKIYSKVIDSYFTLLKTADEIDPDEISHQITQSEMFQKRLLELLQIKQFVNENYTNLLPIDLFYSNKKLKEANLPSNEQELNEESTKYLGKKQERSLDESLLLKEIKLKKRNTRCYICKTMFTKQNVNKSKSSLCNNCANFSQSFKTIALDLTGRVAVVTGGRVKIGYEIVKKLLEYNCKVIVTSRFPKDTLLKYQKEANYSKWKDNLIIFPIDFRFFKSTNIFISYLYDNYGHIDILINNAAQTIRRTSAYYHYLLPIESTPLSNEEEKKIVKCDYINTNLNLSLREKEEGIEEEEDIECTTLIQSSKDSNNQHLPFSVFSSLFKIMKEKPQPMKTQIGSDGQPYDFSKGKSSWNMEIDDVPFEEFIEVQLINVWTPYYLNIKLKELMMKSPFKDRYIVNVSSVEGMFNSKKTTRHPHTNMAKAALNMMTRTVGTYYKKSGIYMTNVDTGWVSEMNEMNKMMENNSDFQLEFVTIPLDDEDGAIRVLHPIIEGVLGKHFYSGVFLKDFKIEQW